MYVCAYVHYLGTFNYFYAFIHIHTQIPAVEGLGIRETTPTEYTKHICAHTLTYIHTIICFVFLNWEFRDYNYFLCIHVKTSPSLLHIIHWQAKNKISKLISVQINFDTTYIVLYIFGTYTDRVGAENNNLDWIVNSFMHS